MAMSNSKVYVREMIRNRANKDNNIISYVLMIISCTVSCSVGNSLRELPRVEARAYCTPLMRHLLSPTIMCSKMDLYQQYLLIAATNLFLNRPQAFSNTQTYGTAPNIPFEDVCLLCNAPSSISFYTLLDFCCGFSVYHSFQF